MSQALDGIRVIDFTHDRSEEHTSELQSQSNLVCRLLLEKKKNRNRAHTNRNRVVCTPTRRSRARPVASSESQNMESCVHMHTCLTTPPNAVSSLYRNTPL